MTQVDSTTKKSNQSPPVKTLFPFSICLLVGFVLHISRLTRFVVWKCSLLEQEITTVSSFCALGYTVRIAQVYNWDPTSSSATVDCEMFGIPNKLYDLETSGDEEADRKQEHSVLKARGAGTR